MRIAKLRLFADYLCGTEPALMLYDVERSCYVSAVTALSDEQLRHMSSKPHTDTETKVFDHLLFTGRIGTFMPKIVLTAV